VWRPTPQVSRLLTAPDRLLPVVGAGLSRAAGLPSGPGLAAWLVHEHGGGASNAVDNCLTVADTILGDRRDDRSIRELQEAVAAHLDLRLWDYTLTPAHKVLTRVRSGLVATFNYDLLLEDAADRQDIDHASLTLRDTDDLADALHGSPKADLVILHLHGHVQQPETIILDASSYSEHVNSLIVRNVLSTLFMTRTVAFLGTALDEPYLLAGLQTWADRKPRHLLFTDDASAAAMTGGRAAISAPRHGVIVSPFPTGEWSQVDVIAEAIAGGATPPPDPDLAVASDEEYHLDYMVGSAGELAPLVPFTVDGPAGTLSDVALVDTGADVSVFPLVYMRRLGIRDSDIEHHTVVGATGEGMAFSGVAVELTILGSTFAIAPLFADTPVPLFGRDDVLQRFVVMLDNARSRLTLRRA
jgi:hypothetical protein